MKNETDRDNRVRGVLLGLAAGDALGAGYEFKPAMEAGEPVGMIGGGLGDFAPGEWTDDTSMAIVMAQALAASGGTASEEACTQMVRGWADWAKSAPDVGVQTSAVLRAAESLARRGGRELPVAADAIQAAEDAHQRTGRSGGNGSLMRTAPVALAYLNRPVEEAFAAAAKLSALTHFDPEAAEACGLWTAAIRHAVLTGQLDLRCGLHLLEPARAGLWEQRISAAEAGAPKDFSNNGWVVEAFQGAWSSISAATGHGTGQAPLDRRVLVEALEAAVRGGVDTDTVAAIAGSLVGAACGARAIPGEWLGMLHGWPGLKAVDLGDAALELAAGH
ncbi:ADP-ribosylglycohydrolase family protein [Glutamicibacter soli]|uniref:ADP-ribosylglycohydrolase family protein n=1 Tax=Glutamicibacter soli TaxID=453836 RepID=A0A6L9G7I0_9MICC|nr:ADP-ribosylglycohydrolase family protein [Glutamicibacter soli]NAZ17158.1 ADP-ribosylglycohydrolase family protein [Glutamicibacter soli]